MNLTRHHLENPTGLWTPVSAATRCPFSTSPQQSKSTNQSKTTESIKDRETLNPDRSEVTKSATDSEIAHHPSAYDPHNTAPESELEAVGKESREDGKGGNPLDVSPANPEVSAWTGPGSEGPTRNVDKGPSGKGATKKSRSIHVKEDGTHVSYRD